MVSPLGLCLPKPATLCLMLLGLLSCLCSCRVLTQSPPHRTRLVHA